MVNWNLIQSKKEIYLKSPEKIANKENEDIKALIEKKEEEIKKMKEILENKLRYKDCFLVPVIKN